MAGLCNLRNISKLDKITPIMSIFRIRYLFFQLILKTSAKQPIKRISLVVLQQA